MLGADRCPESPTEFGVSRCDRETSKMGMPLPTEVCSTIEKHSASNSQLLNIDCCLALSIIWRRSVIFTTVCSMALNKPYTSGCLRQREKSDWPATMSQTHSSEPVVTFRNKCVKTEKRNISSHGLQHCVTVYMYCTWLSVTATAEFSVVGFINECWIRNDVTVNGDGIIRFFVI